MPVIPSAVLQRIATLPIAIHEAGEIVFAAGTTTGRLLILTKGAVTIEKEGTEIAKVTELGAVFGELSALLNQPHTADVRTLEASEFRVARRAPRRRFRHTFVRCGNPGTASRPCQSSPH